MPIHDISKPYTFSQNGKLVPPLPKPAPNYASEEMSYKMQKTETNITGNHCYELTIVAVSGRIAPPGFRK